MQDNWYEAAVSAIAPHRIISVVDWASDSPMPTRKPESKPIATYNVFAWGINDPSEGNRTIEKENYDALASPVGWHSLPYANDPSVGTRNRKGAEFWHNTSTTVGNNVSLIVWLLRIVLLTVHVSGLCSRGLGRSEQLGR